MRPFLVVLMAAVLASCDIGLQPEGGDEESHDPVDEESHDPVEGLSAAPYEHAIVVRWDLLDGHGTYTLFWTDDGTVPGPDSERIDSIHDNLYYHASLDPDLTYTYTVCAQTDPFEWVTGATASCTSLPDHEVMIFAPVGDPYEVWGSDTTAGSFYSSDGFTLIHSADSGGDTIISDRHQYYKIVAREGFQPEIDAVCLGSRGYLYNAPDVGGCSLMLGNAHGLASSVFGEPDGRNLLFGCAYGWRLHGHTHGEIGEIPL